MTSRQSFVLRDQYIELYKLLKLESIASSGGEAKSLVSNGQVKVNGQIETRKRRKLVDQDKVQVDDVIIDVKNESSDACLGES